jgi:Spy/CpxP family protein refolding chaperone
MRRQKVLLVVLSLGFFSFLVLAQTTGQEPLGRARENIHRLRLLRMTEALDLTEEQTALIYPAASRVEKAKVEILRRLNKGMRDLREKLNTDAPDEAAISEMVEGLKKLRADLLAKDKEFEDFLDTKLTPLQRGRYLIFSAEFYRGLGEQLNRARALTREKKRS